MYCLYLPLSPPHIRSQIIFSSSFPPKGGDDVNQLLFGTFQMEEKIRDITIDPNGKRLAIIYSTTRDDGGNRDDLIHGVAIYSSGTPSDKELILASHDCILVLRALDQKTAEESPQYRFLFRPVGGLFIIFVAFFFLMFKKISVIQRNDKIPISVNFRSRYADGSLLYIYWSDDKVRIHSND